MGVVKDKEVLEQVLQVKNQPPELVDYNLFKSDRVAAESLSLYQADWARSDLEQLGRRLGSAEVIEWGFLANRFTPEFHPLDRFGHRIDRVEFHPAYHHLMSLGVEAGIHAAPWRDPRPGAQVARAIKHYMLTQIEAGVGCPLTMTFAAVPALRQEPAVAGLWEDKLLALEYDGRFLPAAEKRGVLMGMAMTEKQGGSDVRANTTRAIPDGEGVRLVGHKWFCSAPMNDAFLTLAYSDEGLGCFLVPRFTPDGEVNSIRIQRLKNKLGNKANASSEIEYHYAFAWPVGAPGRGVPTIIEMVNHTRLDCVIGSSGLMRAALVQAAHHTAHRSAFGKTLRDWPLMANVLADLTLECEAALRLALRLAVGYEQSTSPEQQAFVRIATAVAKYWVCKRTPPMVVEALECHGGNGYVEESVMPRLYREAPLSSIWEGSGNVICLDVLRALSKTPQTGEVLVAELEGCAGHDPSYDKHLELVKRDLKEGVNPAGARRSVERMALLLQASLMLRDSPVGESFCIARLQEPGHEYGTLPDSVDFGTILERIGHPLS